ncbi:MAG: hypothetical protein KAS05_02715 [Candidatus Omnitrophica bacterium]|nr:hypothetical protein [Candidatus Omnitrophota bacterium]
MKAFIILVVAAFLMSSSVVGGDLAFAEGIKNRFQNKEKLVYDVYFNGISAGYIEWEYLGRKEVDGITVDVLSVNSDTNILNLLDLDSEEKVFINSETSLPVRVERDIVFFGKKEIIKEVYDQEKGQIKITNSSSKKKEEIFAQDIPIYNILQLLYFFPQDLALEAGEWMIFNLPTQKMKIKMVKERVLKFNGDKRDTYFLIGRGAKRFSLWLDKEEKIPLRLEFISLAGKITVVRKED